MVLLLDDKDADIVILPQAHRGVSTRCTASDDCNIFLNKILGRERGFVNLGCGDYAQQYEYGSSQHPAVLPSSRDERKKSGAWRRLLLYSMRVRCMASALRGRCLPSWDMVQQA